MTTNTLSEKNIGLSAGTAYGVVALLLWSTNIALSRTLAEQMGIFTAGASLLLAGGALGIIWQLRVGKLPWKRPSLHAAILAALVIVNLVSLYLALGLSATHAQVVKVGLLNYLWPVATLVLSLRILRRRAGLGLALGVLFALAGIALLMLPNHADIPMPECYPMLPYVLAIIAALSWGLYSTLTRRWIEQAGAMPVAVPIFLSGLLLAFMRLHFHEHTVLTPSTCLILVFTAVGPTWLAYSFWERSMRTGDVTLLASLSFLIPLVSTLCSALVLRLLPDLHVWLACMLLILGAAICRKSVHEPPAKAIDNH